MAVPLAARSLLAGPPIRSSTDLSGKTRVALSRSCMQRTLLSENLVRSQATQASAMSCERTHRFPIHYHAAARFLIAMVFAARAGTLAHLDLWLCHSLRRPDVRRSGAILPLIQASPCKTQPLASTPTVRSARFRQHDSPRTHCFILKHWIHWRCPRAYYKNRCGLFFQPGGCPGSRPPLRSKAPCFNTMDFRTSRYLPAAPVPLVKVRTAASDEL